MFILVSQLTPVFAKEKGKEKKEKENEEEFQIATMEATTTHETSSTTQAAGITEGSSTPTVTPHKSSPKAVPLKSFEPAQPQNFFVGNYYRRAGFNERTTRTLELLGFFSAALGVTLLGGRIITARSL